MLKYRSMKKFAYKYIKYIFTALHPRRAVVLAMSEMTVCLSVCQTREL